MDRARPTAALLASLLAIVLAWALPGIAGAAPVSYRADVALSADGPLEYLQDRGGQLSVQSVSATRFTALRGGTVNFGFGTAAYWLHLAIDSHVSEPTTIYLSIAQPTLDDVRLYAFAGGRLRQSVRSGDLLPTRVRIFPGSHPLLPWHVDPGVHYELYLRVQSRMGALLVPMQFQSAADVEHDARLSLLLNGAFSGLFAALFLYNLFLALSLRERAYTYYAMLLPFGYLACTAISGFGSWILYPQSAWPGNQGLPLFAGAAFMLNMLFARDLLATHTIRWLDRLLLVTAALDGLMAACSWLAPAGWVYPSCLVLAFLTPLMGLLAGATCLARRHPQARFYLMAQVCTAAGLLVTGLTIGDLLPFSALGRNALTLGGSLQALLFSLALADRIRELQLAARSAREATRRALEDRQQELEHSVEQRTRELEEARRHAEYLATTDALTGVYNRRGLLPLVEQAIQRSVRHATPLSLVSFDLDQFKRINDDFGHAEGDRVLCQLVNLTETLVRPSDLLGRTGGEEFMLVLGLPRAEAAQVAERLRAHLQGHLTAGAEQRVVTASFGVASLSRSLSNLDSLQRAADAALYRAKSRGGNRVESYEASSNETSRTRAIMRDADPAPPLRNDSRFR